MVNTLAYFRLVRLPILALIALIQYCIRYFILEPMLQINGYELLMSDRQFFYLVLSTVLIAAGGYAINDYFDVKTDRVNKLKRVIVDRYIKRRVAMTLHIVLTSLGFALASYLSWKLGMWRMSSLFIFVIFSLWFYSTNLQHQILTGNIAIALMAGFVPLIVGLFEIPLQNAAHPELLKEYGYSIFNIPAYWVIGFSVILFLLTLIREVTKDVIDIRGDRMFGASTFPIRFGVKASKSLIIALYAVFGAGLSWAYFSFLHVHLGMGTIFSIVVLLLILQLILIFRAKTKKHFSYSSDLNNVITVIMILSLYLIKVSIETYFS